MNTTKDFHPSDRAFVNFGCGCCHECLSIKKNDWQFRCFAQCLYRTYHGYHIYFCTLTYNNAHLPHYTYSTEGYYDFVRHDYDVKNLTVECFSREDVNHFIRGIQQDLLRKFDVKDIDYLLCSEFGGETSRPHYHLILLVPDFDAKFPKDSTLDHISQQSLTVHGLIKKHWSDIIPDKYDKHGTPLRESKGFIFPRVYCGGLDLDGFYHNPLLVDSSAIANTSIYISKYTAKQLDFFMQPNLVEIEKTIKKKNIPGERCQFRKILPFLKVSQHFGECINEIVSSPQVPSWCNGLVTCDNDTHLRLLDGVFTPLHKKATTIPDYNRRKLLQNRVKVGEQKVTLYDDSNLSDPGDLHSLFTQDLWDIQPEDIGVVPHTKTKYLYETSFTDFGMECIEMSYNRDINNTLQVLNDFFNITLNDNKFHDFLKLALSTDVNEDVYNFINNSVDNYKLIPTFDNVINILKSFKNKRRHLSIYKVVYKDKISLLHQVFLDACPDFFVKYSVNDRPTYHWRTRKNGKRNIYITISDLYVYDPTFVVPFDPTLPGSQMSCPFHGDETVDEMMSLSRDFYNLQMLTCRDPFHDLPPDVRDYRILFNSFSCFKYFDMVLDIIKTYNDTLKIPKYEANYQKELERKKSKNKIYK